MIARSIPRSSPAPEGRREGSGGCWTYNDGPYSDHTVGLVDDLVDQAERLGVDPDHYAANWRLQLGSLGSGNHFIEVSADEEGQVWLFLHSGSRGVGNKMAQHHIRVAQQLAAKWWISLPDPDLAYLVEGTDEFWAYIRDLRWAQHFALLNRVEMMDRVRKAFTAHLRASELAVTMEVNCHHNYTEKERHWGKEVWLSRKDRKSTRLNSSHANISYAVFCLKKKKICSVYKVN